MDELVKRAKEGDSAALEELVAHYKGLVRALANRFYLMGGDKDDLLQEGMIGLVCAINRYDEGKGPFPPFVRVCVLAQLINAVRHDGVLGQQAMASYVAEEEILDMPDESVDPGDLLLKKEFAQRFWEAVQQLLSPIERQVVTLFADGYSYKYIAAQTGRSVKAVDGALQRARKKLLENLH